MAVMSSALYSQSDADFAMLNEHEEEVSPRAEVCASAYACLHLPNIMWVIGIFLTIGIAAIKHFLQLLQLQNSCHLAPILCSLRAPRLGSLQTHAKESVLEALEVELHNTHGPPIQRLVPLWGNGCCHTAIPAYSCLQIFHVGCACRRSCAHPILVVATLVPRHTTQIYQHTRHAQRSHTRAVGPTTQVGPSLAVSSVHFICFIMPKTPCLLLSRVGLD